MGKISKKVLEKIEKENIKPIGRWSFVLKNSVLWSLFGLNILFGSVGFAISIYLFESTDVFDLILSVNDLLEAAILAIPTIWILLTILFLLVAYLNFRYTDRGYILSFRKIFVINTLAILILGGILHLSGVSERLNRVFSESFSTYDITLDPRYRIWSSPETGYLAGTILLVNKESIEIEDLDGDIWSIDIFDAKVRRAVGLLKGEKVKIVGNVVDESTFQALEILPWEGRGRNMQEKHF